MPDDDDPFKILTPDQCIILLLGVLGLALILAPWL